MSKRNWCAVRGLVAALAIGALPAATCQSVDAAGASAVLADDHEGHDGHDDDCDDEDGCEDEEVLG